MGASAEEFGEKIDAGGFSGEMTERVCENPEKSVTFAAH